jgi:ABC-2 type transport system permease protein
LLDFAARPDNPLTWAFMAASHIGSDVVIRTSEPPRLRIPQRSRELWAARQILWNLVRKEVKVKYKSSILGMAWSMLNPILYLAVFSVVFGIILPNSIPHFPIYILSGLLAWNLYSTSLGVGARSVVDNANLVTKVYFPRELLPLSSVGTALVDTGLQAVVLLLFMAGFRAYHFGFNLLLLPLALAALLCFTTAMAMFVSALNVRYRDTQYLLNIVLLVWFWFTPIVYPSSRIVGKHVFGVPVLKLFQLNPMADIVFGFQRVFYGVPNPIANGEPVNVLVPFGIGYLAVLLSCVLAGALLLLLLAWRTYFHMSGDFAEEL